MLSCNTRPEILPGHMVPGKSHLSLLNSQHPYRPELQFARVHRHLILYASIAFANLLLSRLPPGPMHCTANPFTDLSVPVCSKVGVWEVSSRLMVFKSQVLKELAHLMAQVYLLAERDTLSTDILNSPHIHQEPRPPYSTHSPNQHVCHALLGCM